MIDDIECYLFLRWHTHMYPYTYILVYLRLILLSYIKHGTLIFFSFSRQDIYATKVDHELLILFSLTPKCWNCRCMTPHLAKIPYVLCFCIFCHYFLTMWTLSGKQYLQLLLSISSCRFTTVKLAVATVPHKAICSWGHVSLLCNLDLHGPFSNI